MSIDRNPSATAGLHEQLLDAVGEAVVARDTDGRIIYWNRAAERLYGWTAQEAIGQAMPELRSVDPNSDARSGWLERIRTGARGSGEHAVIRRDGTSLLIRYTDAPIRDADGSVAGVIRIACDVSAERATEQALRDSELRFRKIVTTAHEGVWLIDSDARTVFVNRRMAELLGYDEAELAGTSLIEFAEDDEKPLMEAKLKERSLGKSDRYEVRLRRRDGTRLWALVSASPFYDEDGGHAGSLGMITDISDLKRTQEALVAARVKAEELSRLKTAFLTNLSHEIRTPLTGILGFTELLLNELPPESRETVDMIQFSAERLLVTLDSLLSLAMLESGVVMLEPTTIDLAEEVRSVFRIHQASAARRGLVLTLESQFPEVPAMLDRRAVHSILANLIGNAVKFTDVGSVTVRLAAEAHKLSIEIADTGIGISPGFLSRIFDDFAQESEGFSRTHEGIGLGLPIARRFVSLMGGTLSVESEKGTGTTFTIEIPTAWAASRAA